MEITTINYYLNQDNVKRKGIADLYDRRVPEYRKNKSIFITQDVDLILTINKPTTNIIPLDVVVAMSLRKVVVMTESGIIINEILYKKRDIAYILENQPRLMINKYEVGILFAEPYEGYLTDIKTINSLLYNDTFYEKIEDCRKNKDYPCLERTVADNPVVFRNGEFAFVDKDGNLNVRFDESSFIERNSAMTSGSIDNEVEKFEYIIVRIGDSIVETFQTKSITNKNTSVLNPYRLVVYHDEFCNLHARLVEVHDEQFASFKSNQIRQEKERKRLEMEERRRKKEAEEEKRRKEEEEKRRKEEEEKRRKEEEEEKRRKEERKREEKRRRLEEEDEETKRKRERKRESQRKCLEKKRIEQKERIEIAQSTEVITNVLVLDENTSDYWEYRSHLSDEESAYYGWENDPQ